MTWNSILSILAVIGALFVGFLFIYFGYELFMKSLFTIIKINKLAEQDRIQQEKKKYDYKEN